MGARRNAFGMIVMLVLQFLVGMTLNLFVDLPTDHPGAGAPEYFSGSVQSVTWGLTNGPIALVIHIVLGIALFGGAIGLLARVRRLPGRGPTVLAIIGLLLVVGAGFNGASFLDYNQDFSSMLMAIFFAGALLTYAGLLYRLA